MASMNDKRMGGRTVDFPSSPKYGEIHFEHGRSWEYVAPGMWKSTSGDGEGLGWDDIENRPDKFPPEEHRHAIGDVDGRRRL